MIPSAQGESAAHRSSEKHEAWRSAWQAYTAEPLDVPAGRNGAGKRSPVLRAAVLFAVLPCLLFLCLALAGQPGVLASSGQIGSVFSRMRPSLGAAGNTDPMPVYFGRKLEPRGHVALHGAGQTDDASFREYSAAVAPSTPMLFMTYVDLKDDLPGFFDGLGANLKTYPSFLVPQIGLSLNAGQATTHYEAQVADGTLDDRIAMLCSGLKALNRPVFLRIGYEFNGQWNGYQPEPYIAAFRRIVLAVQTCAPETAAVWDFAPDGSDADYMRFYPGDAFVDWWAINLFDSSSFAANDTRHFLADALVHRFPVMIAESTPRGHSVTGGQSVVDLWYRPYFDLIRTMPQIKAFCYISWDWRQYAQWADWGDARIEENPTILAFYRHAVADRGIRSATTEAATRSLLNLSTPPSAR